jgi:hypothetical protein
MIRFHEDRAAAEPGRGPGGAELPALLRRLRDLPVRLLDVHRRDRLGGAGQPGQRDRAGSGVYRHCRPPGLVAAVGRGDRRPARAAPGDDLRGRIPLRCSGDARGRTGLRAAAALAVRPARLARGHGHRILYPGPECTDGRDRAAEPACQRELAVWPSRLGDQDRWPSAGRGAGRRGRFGRGGRGGRGHVRRERAGPQPAPAAQRRARNSGNARYGTPSSLDAPRRRGRGLGGLPDPDVVVGGHRAVRVPQPDHLGALDAARTGRGPRLSRRRRGLGRDHGGPGRRRDRGRSGLPGPAPSAAHGGRRYRHVRLRAARHPDGPARRGPLGGTGCLRLRRGVGDLQRFQQHHHAAADPARAAGPGQFAHALSRIRHRRHRVRGRRAARRRTGARHGLRGGCRLRAAEQRDRAGPPGGPRRPLARQGPSGAGGAGARAGAGAGRGAPARGGLTAASGPRRAGRRTRPAGRPR